LFIFKLLDISTVVTRHELTVQQNDIFDKRSVLFHRIYKLFDIVVLLSHMEESYYKLMGCNARYIPNPIQFELQKPSDITERRNILWIGRLDRRQKNYRDALEIIKLLVKSKPDIKMYMVGGEYSQGAFDEIRSFIKDNNLHKNIVCTGYTTDVEKYYHEARVHLVTSSYESFPMMMIESKSLGIPMVTYSMPWLELLRDGKGFFEVPQHDIQKASEMILDILNDDNLCSVMSREAFESIAEFNRFNQYEAWRQIFYDLKNLRNVADSDGFIEASFLRLFFEIQDRFYLSGCSYVQSLRNKINFLGGKVKNIEKPVENKDMFLNINQFRIKKYIKYKILSKISFGKFRERYKQKYSIQKELYKKIILSE
jgi:glycosyltransferase involved in cell wall biosynthesis